MKYKSEVACTLVTWAEGAWNLHVSSHWSFRAQCYSCHMPTASTLESSSYLVSGSAELNIKICIHKPEHFTESKFYLSYCTAGGTEAHKVTWGVCDRGKSRIQLLPYHDALHSGLLLLPKTQLVQSHPETLAQFLPFVVNCWIILTMKQLWFNLFFIFTKIETCLFNLRNQAKQSSNYYYLFKYTLNPRISFSFQLCMFFLV